tara:strand:+ start:499 stop:849 length:351 start_codon:yes stop_codon:yes gene_type:complete
MEEDEPKILVPVITGNIVLRGLPYDVKDRLVRIKRIQEWNSWADMAYWVLENSHKISQIEIDWDDSDSGFIVCRDVPLEIRDELGRVKRIHGWGKWTDMVAFVLNELEEDSDDLQN